MSVKTKYLLLALILVLGALYIVGYVSGRKVRDRASQTQIDALNARISVYSTVLNKTKVTVAQKEQLILTQRDALKKDSLTREELRKLNIKQASEITKLKLRIDTLLADVSHNGQIIQLDTVFLDKRSGNAILLPFSFEKKDKWLNLQGSFDGQGKLNVSLKMDAKVDIYLGVDKTTKKYTASVLTDNTYLNTISVNSIKMDVPTVKRYGIGVIGGYGIGLGNPLRAMPFIGFGISYNLIKF
jgi:hypothetical protein